MDEPGSLSWSFPQQLPSPTRRPGDEHEAGARSDASLGPIDGRSAPKTNENTGKEQKKPKTQGQNPTKQTAPPPNVKKGVALSPKPSCEPVEYREV
jgi:hypothetical protein